MNKDFHFYGTFVAALEAGFCEEKAKLIADAAQMVDDCTTTYIKEKYPGSGYIETCEGGLDNFRDLFKDTEAVYHPTGELNEELRRIRTIWMPFHFLPGNFGDMGDAYVNGADELVRDKEDFRCLCLHNSELVKIMVDDTVRYWGNVIPAAQDEKEKLYLLGIRMHVLADTWAHEYFTGTPSKRVNDAGDFRILEGDHATLDRIGTVSGMSNYSIMYLGHGRAGHYPDYGCLCYEYHPAWMGSNSKIIKNNPYNFCAAFAQMVDAMSSVQQAHTFQIKSDQDIMEDFEASRPECKAAVQNVVSTKENDQSRAWQAMLRGMSQVRQIPEYRTENIDMDAFQHMAVLQRDLVVKYLQEKDINI